MLSLAFDVKCGYETCFITEKNVLFPLDMILDKTLFDKVFKDLDKKFLSETEFYQKYISFPHRIIIDYNLAKAIKTMMSLDYAAKAPNLFDRFDPTFYPEYFKIENVRLIVDSEDDKQEELADVATAIKGIADKKSQEETDIQDEDFDIDIDDEAIPLA